MRPREAAGGGGLVEQEADATQPILVIGNVGNSATDPDTGGD